jgi:hypothetical protein
MTPKLRTTRKKPKAVRIRSSLHSALALADQMEITRKALKKHGRHNKAAIAELLALADLFMPIKLVPKQFEGLVERVRSALDRLRQQERASCSSAFVMRACRVPIPAPVPGQRSRRKLVRRLAKARQIRRSHWSPAAGHHSLPAS